MTRSRLVSLAKLVGLCALLGVVMGAVWYFVAPTPAFVVRPGGLGYVKELPSEYVAMDGWFAVLAVVAGILVAAGVLRRGRGHLDPWTVLVVPLAGLLGSLVAWGVGRTLGADDQGVDDGRLDAASQVGDVFHGALTLTAKGVLLVWPVVSLAILTFALAWTSRDDRPRPVDAAAGPSDGTPIEQASVGGDRDLGDLDRRE